MNFELKWPVPKEETVYKTVYMKRSLARRIDRIAAEHNISFNRVVISMIESCLKDEQ